VPVEKKKKEGFYGSCKWMAFGPFAVMCRKSQGTFRRETLPEVTVLRGGISNI
jgi:hypothetical protein